MAKRIWTVIEPMTALYRPRVTFLSGVDINELHKVPFLKNLKTKPHIRLATPGECLEALEG